MWDEGGAKEIKISTQKQGRKDPEEPPTVKQSKTTNLVQLKD